MCTVLAACSYLEAHVGADYGDGLPEHFEEAQWSRGS